MRDRKTYGGHHPLLFTASAVIGVWILAEFGMLLFAYLNPSVLGNDFPVMYQAHPYRAFKLTPNVTDRLGQSSHNSLGMRGPEVNVDKPDDTIRVVCMGGSTTISVGATTDSHTYPARMGAILQEHYRDAPFNIEVLNAGVGASNSMESLIYFETRILDFDPDVVVYHHGMNDVWIMTIMPQFATDYSHARRPFYIDPPKWWEISPFLSYWFAKDSIFNRYFPARHPNVNALITKKPSTVRNYSPRSMRELEPRMLAAYRRNLVSFISVARGNGVLPVISTQVYYDDRGDGGLWYRSIGQISEIVRDVATSESVDLIDFGRDMKWSTDRFFDACHMKDNDKGLGEKARFFADSLIEKRVVERAWERRTTDSTRR